MEKLNELIDFYEMDGTDPQLLVWLLELRRHRENNWQQRAEAAEAKLAEMEKQEPVAWHIYQWRDSPKGWDWYLTKSFSSQPKIGDGWKSVPLFTRPAPAINLAKLVPDAERIHNEFDDWREGWNACRATILRNIEEAG
ncbi:hypothetical protein [Pantoea anthophila]|uniref:hypothetical protein n=1 Tax=Pantoea anthophila TaxID=470931 RepID=UPI002787E589|nr:hypothetical protein [Pantoea anthophila]MDQ1214548.1 hypothetical protein [Pantoea anthophila]